MKSPRKEAAEKTPRKNAAKKAAVPARTAAPAKVAAPAKAAAAPKAPAAPRDGASTGPRIDRSRYQYSSSDTKSASGRKTVNNGDLLAKALEGKNSEAVVEILVANGGEPKDTWANLNEGMRRMSAGNVLRALWRKNGHVTIEGKRVRFPQPAAAE